MAVDMDDLGRDEMTVGWYLMKLWRSCLWYEEREVPRAVRLGSNEDVG